MVNLFDYMFWRWYCFFCKYKVFRGMEAEDAFSMPFIIFTLPIAFLLGVCIQLGIIPDFAITDTERRMKLIVIVLPVYFLCSYRYLYYPKIKKNNYEIFRKKWGNEPLSIRRRRKWLIIALFVFNCIIFPLLLILLQILLKHN